MGLKWGFNSVFVVECLLLIRGVSVGCGKLVDFLRYATFSSILDMWHEPCWVSEYRSF